jgi:diguanylate cyclase (GGDEF)-like protein
LQTERPARAEHPGTLILADLDCFKAVNDTYGHAAGDAVLQAFAEVATGTVRSTDLVGRYGGEEFIILLPGATVSRSEDVTRTISTALRAHASAPGLAMPTVSYGITAIEAGDVDLVAAIASADRALYAAKASGRDRAVRAPRRTPDTGTTASGPQQERLGIQ